MSEISNRIMLEDILLQVNKPARYLGNEWNATKKNFDDLYIKFALCFPDLYDVGMSNFGMRILYGILNNIPDVVCERIFHPATDMESLMREKSLKLFSLESQKTLTDFDIVGFSLAYELNYTNILNILDLAAIPLLSSQRTGDFPLIIAGGSCCLNPEPMAEFIDLFVIGEAEEAIIEIIDVYRQEKRKTGTKRPNKKDVLYALAQIEGVYVPSLYSVEYNSDGTINSYNPKSQNIKKTIKKRLVKDFDKLTYPINWLVPYLQTIHDRITIEVMRGCPNRCRFCQARSMYFPYRYAIPKKIIELAKQTYSLTGYEDISLLGLSISDYHNITAVLADLIELFKQEMVSISLPSLRPKDNVRDLLALITKIKKSGLTLAPEVATSRLRKIINKDFDMDIFFGIVRYAYNLGYKNIKVYFMI